MGNRFKFRGISILTGEFVYGGGIDTQRDTPMIINQGERTPVVKGTIGQFSGFKDCKGVDIYDDDSVYVAGYGIYDCEFPYDVLFDAVMENDIGEIKGNLHNKDY